MKVLRFLLFVLLFPAAGFADNCLCTKQVSGDRIPLVNDVFAQKYPYVAFDSLNGNYLITWTDTQDYKRWRIRGRLFNSAGLAISGTLEFDSSPSSFTTQVLYNSVTQEYLVTWIAARTLYGQIVTFDGRLATPKLTIAVFSPLFSVIEYKVVLNRVQNEYMILYSISKTKRTEIFLQRLDRFGNKIRPPFQINGEKLIRPDVDYDPDSNRYLVAWEEQSGVFSRVRYQIFNSSLQKLFHDARTIQSNAKNKVAPRVVYDPAIRQFAIFWEECFACERMHASLYGPDGIFGGETVMNIGLVEIKQIRYNPITGGFMVLYETVAPRSPQFARLDRNFHVVSKNVVTNCQSGFQISFSSMIFNSSLQQFLVVWSFADFSTQNDDVFGQMIRAVPRPGPCR